MAPDTVVQADLIHAIVARHRHLDGPLLPILHAVQHALGYVPDDALPIIAAELNLSRAEVHGVVTFYHDFRTHPPGAHIVKLCRAEACQSRGGDALVSRAEAHLGVACGHTTPDGRVTLEPVFCLGLCASGPSAMVNGRVVGRLTPARLDDVMKEVSA